MSKEKNNPILEEDGAQEGTSPEEEPTQQSSEENSPAEDTSPAEEQEPESDDSQTPDNSPEDEGDIKVGNTSSGPTKDVGIEYKRMSEDMKKKLDSQERVQVHIPKGENEPAGAIETVQINGHRMEIQKGAMVRVPRQVADILMNYLGIEDRVGNEMKVDRQGDVQEALE